MSFIDDILNGGKGAGFQAATPNSQNLQSFDQDRNNLVATNQAQQSAIKTWQDAIAKQQAGPKDGMEAVANKLAVEKANSDLGAINDRKGVLEQKQNGPSIIQQNPDDLVGRIKQQQGQQDQVYGQQQDLASALKDQMAGNGPNPAQSMLREATDANTKNAAGVIASTKGINPALAARLAGQNTANTNQQAANQASTLRANQQLGAQQQLGGVLSGLSNNALSGQQLGQQAIGTQNSTNAGIVANQNATNAHVASGNSKTQGGLLGGALNAAGGALSALLNKGGKVKAPALPGFGAIGRKAYADGGEVEKHGGMKFDFSPDSLDHMDQDGMASLGHALGSKLAGALKSRPQDSKMPMNSTTGPITGLDYSKPASDMMGVSSGPALGGMTSMSAVPSLQMPAMAPSTPSAPSLGAPTFANALMRNKGGQTPRDFRSGGDVPGKANVKGDSPKNDTVPAWLSPGEIVIPRSKAKDPEAAKKFIQKVNGDDAQDNDGKAKEFMKALKSHSEKDSAVKGAPREGYAKVLHSHRKLEKRIKELEQKMKRSA